MGLNHKIMQREITMTPAYDKRDPDPSKNYGVHGVNIVYVLKGKLGAVQFVLYTNWMGTKYREESLSDNQQM